MNASSHSFLVTGSSPSKRSGKTVSSFSRTPPVEHGGRGLGLEDKGTPRVSAPFHLPPDPASVSPLCCCLVLCSRLPGQGLAPAHDWNFPLPGVCPVNLPCQGGCVAGSPAEQSSLRKQGGDLCFQMGAQLSIFASGAWF